MESIWMGIAAGRETTRVIAMTGPDETILKALMAREPRHPRAIPPLLEAAALGQGQPVRAARCADSWGYSCDSTFCREVTFDWGDGRALYSVMRAPSGAHRLRRHRLGGLGNFAAQERLVTTEVAR